MKLFLNAVKGSTHCCLSLLSLGFVFIGEDGKSSLQSSASPQASSSNLNNNNNVTSNCLCHARFTMKNVSTSAVIFRIQTTSFMAYRVRPSHGKIEAGQQLEVQAVMVSDTGKKNDKFQVKFAAVTGEAERLSDFDAQFQALEASMQRKRLICVFPEISSLLSNSPGSVASAVAAKTNNTNVYTATTPKTPIASINGSLSASSTSMNSPKSPQETMSFLQAATSPAVRAAALSEEKMSVVDLASELRIARSRILQLTAELEVLKSHKGVNVTAPRREWAQLLQAQYGVPPVLLLLVAIFAFLVGLLF